jgi:hypothetical protein
MRRVFETYASILLPEFQSTIPDKRFEVFIVVGVRVVGYDTV